MAPVFYFCRSWILCKIQNTGVDTPCFLFLQILDSVQNTKCQVDAPCFYFCRYWILCKISGQMPPVSIFVGSLCEISGYLPSVSIFVGRLCKISRYLPLFLFCRQAVQNTKYLGRGPLFLFARPPPPCWQDSF